MARFRVFYQMTIDEYLEAQEELFPEDLSVPARPAYNGPWRIKGSVPVFPGAIDGIGSAPAAPAPVQVVFSKYRRRR